MEVEITDETYSANIGRYVRNCTDEELFRFFVILKDEVNSRIVHINENYGKYWR